MPVGEGLDGVMEVIAALPEVAEDRVDIHAGEGVVDAGTDSAVLGVYR